MSEYKINATITFANIDEADAFADFLQDTLAETPEAIEIVVEKLYDDDGNPLTESPSSV